MDKKTPKPKKTVSREEFESLKKATEESTMTILDAIKATQNQPQTPAQQSPVSRTFSVTGQQDTVIRSEAEQVNDASAESSNYTLSPAYQKIFNEYFDPEDGFEGRLEYPYFTIIVPSKFSNASPAWKKYYKTDTRLKFIRHDNIEGDIRNWCKMVARNIQYDKNVKTR